MKHLRLLILAGALAAVAVPPATATANEFAGIVSNDAFAGDTYYRNTEFGRMETIGIGMIRQTFTWASIEGRRGRYNFGNYDDFVSRAAQHGIRVLPILFDPPRFRSSRPKKHAKHGTYFPKRYSDLGVFGAQVAKRYGPNGTFWTENPGVPKLPITAYQIWNEPNLGAYSPPKPSAKKYVKLLKASKPRIRAVDPAAEIVTAGLPDSRLSKPNLYKFVTQMYKAGAKGSFNALGINPYAPTAGSMLHKLRKIRAIMRRFHDSGSQIWVTELGWSDVGPKAPFRVGAAGQAQRIRDTIAALKQSQSSLNLQGFFYFSWADGAVYAGGHDFWGLHTGLLRKDGSAKPAFAAFQTAVAAL
jgi:polysaccharide biosynthesis protein PslG